jgi:TP901 family phage tail tape measure protein
VSDLQVSVAFVVENQEQLARALEQAGGKIGSGFGANLSAEAQRHLDQLIRGAEQAANRVGAIFKREDLTFRTPQGGILPPAALDQLSQANKGFAEARAAIEALRQSMNRMGQEGQRSFNLLESAVEGVAISLTGRLTDSITSSLQKLQGLVTGFLELDKQLRLAAAAAGEQGGYQRLGTVVDKVGIDAAGTSQQVAELATSLVRAGFSVSEVEGALSGVVRGAEATGTGFEQFGEIVGNTLRGFGLEVDQTARVVDVLVNTANSSNASIQGLGYTFEYTASIAKVLGVSLEDVAAMAGLMANAGIQGSVAGTGLRTFLQKLQQAAGGATPEVLGLARGQERLATVMRKLGAEVIDTNGKLLPMEQAVLRLKAGFDKLNEGDKVQLANILFGDEAASKVLSMVNQNGSAISKMFGDIRRSAGAADTAREAMAGMGLEVQQLQGTVDSLGKTIGGVAAAGLRPLVGMLNLAAGGLAGMDGTAKTAAAALVVLGAAATGTTILVAGLRLALDQVAAKAGGMAVVRAAAMSAAGGIAAMAGSLAALAAIPIVIGALTGRLQGVDRTTKELVLTIGTLGTAVAVFRLARFAVEALNARLAVTSGLLAGLTTGAKGKVAAGLIAIAVAALGAKVAYDQLNKSVTVADEDITQLSDKSRELNTQIEQLQDSIAEGKRLKIDTSESERKLASLLVRRLEVERPLEIKLEIKKAEDELKALKKRQEKDGSTLLRIDVRGLDEYRKLLVAMERGGSLKGFSGEVLKGVDYIREQERIVKSLTEQKIKLPLSAEVERAELDKAVSEAQQRLDKTKVLIRLQLEYEQAGAAEDRINQALKTAKGAARDDLLLAREDVLRKIAGITERAAIANRELAAIGSVQVEQAKAKKQTESERLAVAKGKLEVEQMALRVGQEQLEVNQASLGVINQYISAVQSYIAAQRDLQQSSFDVRSSRIGGRTQEAERELALMREREASGQAIAEQEAYIRDLREQARQVDIESTAARLQGLAESFQIERQVLEIKQIQAQLEQGAATQSAQSNVLQQKQTLLEIEGKLADPSLTEPQRQALRDQAAIQKELISIAGQKLQIEQGRTTVLRVIQELERDTMQAQQQATANRERASAASKEYEELLGKQLGILDESAGALNRAVTAQQELVGEIKVAGQPVVYLYNEISKLPEPISAATSRVNDMTAALAAAVVEAQRLAAAMGGSGALQARWAGGDAVPGQDYQVNELGTESFLSRSGTLSLITAPRYGRWSPPTPGVVLPAHVTRHLQARGAFEGRSGGLPRVAATAIGPAVSRGGPDFAPLQRSIDQLDRTIRTHRPSVEVTMPGNAGLLHTLQSIR